MNPQTTARAEQDSFDARDVDMWAHAERLDQGFANLEEAVMNRGPIGYTLSVLEKVSREGQIAIAIVGGIAASFHGLQRTTQDVDIVVDRSHFALFCEKAAEAGFVQEGPSRFSIKGGYPVDVLLSGTHPTPDSLCPIPTPAELGVEAGLNYANLPAWISLKLLAGRPEDLGDVYRLLRQRRDSERRELGDKLDPRAQSKYRQVVEDLKRRLS